jgi:ankyrin repeat protein
MTTVRGGTWHHQQLFARLGGRVARDAAAALAEIRHIVERHPPSVTTPIDGEYALHRAIENRPNDLELIQYLVERHPPALQEKDRYGRLPLHLAIDHGAGIGTIRYLVEASPQAVHARDEWGFFPVHSALRSDPDEYGPRGPLLRDAVIKLLANKWPASLDECTANGTPPLNLLFVDDDKDDPTPVPRAADPELVRFLLETWPPSVRKTDGNGRTVLHVAVKNKRTPREVIRMIVEAWPFSVRARETTAGYLPVHLAASAASPDVLPWGLTKYLLGRWPRSVQEKTETGKTVLHYFLLHLRAQGGGGDGNGNDGGDQDEEDGELDEDYYGSEQDSDAEIDDDGDDDADGDEPDAATAVRRLVRRWPQSVREETNEGFVALHLAARVEMPTSVVRFLFWRWPRSVRKASRKGWLPLHRAMEYGASLPAVRFLVRQYPASVRRRTTNHRRLLPLHLALREEAPFEVVEFLILQWTRSLHEATGDGSLALHVALDRPCSYRRDAAYWLRVTRCLVEHHPASVHVANRAGRLPVHLAAASRDVPWEVVRLLVEQAPAPAPASAPSSALAPDPDGCLPLHHAACRPVPSVELVRYLADCAPGSVRTPDRRGHLPLHKSLARKVDLAGWYVFWKAQLPVVKALVGAWPASLTVPDHEGRIPLLVAAESDASLDVLLFLLTRHPLALLRGGGGLRRRRHPVDAGPTKRPRLH